MASNPHISTLSRKKPFRVALVDDHHVVRAGLRAVLAECAEIEVIWEAEAASTALARCIEALPDLLIVDLRLADESGIDLCREIKLSYPLAKVLFLTSYGDEGNVLAGLSAGADGYLLKSITGSDITDAALKVLHGGTVLDPLITKQVVQHFAGSPSSQPNQISSRQQRILEGVSKGMLNKEIASTLGISEKTVRNQLTAIYDKLGVKRRAEAALHFEKLKRNFPF